MMSRALAVATVLTFAATGAMAGPAAAAAPTITRMPVYDQFDDLFLTEQCGVPVTGIAEGFRILREVGGDNGNLTSVLTLNITVTLTAGNNTVRLKDVGADLARTTPDGDPIVQQVGQLPFQFKGAVRFNAETGEVLLEPRDISQKQIEQVCAALTA
jgi:hypothetical protein